MRRATLALPAAVLLVLAAGCGDDGEPAEPESDPATEWTIVSENLQFDLEQVVVPVGEPVTLTHENLDDGVAHNVHVRTDGEPKTDLEEGPVTQTLEFTIDEAGNSRLVCDIHPNMRADVIAVAPSS